MDKRNEVAKYLLEVEFGIPSLSNDQWLNHINEAIKFRFLERADHVIELINSYS